MKKINICVIGYTIQYKKFLSHIYNNSSKYNLSLIYKNDINAICFQTILQKNIFYLRSITDTPQSPKLILFVYGNQYRLILKY